MGGTHTVVMGDSGLVVIPTDVCTAAGLETGTPLILVNSPSGLLLLTRSQARAMIKAQLSDTDFVAELIAERRAEAAAG